MSDIKAGDAVRTKRGDGLVQDVNDAGIVVFFLDGSSYLFWDGNGVARLVPDTGLAEEVRALVEHAEMYTTEEEGPALWVRAVDLETALDAAEEFLNVHAPTSAQVTREPTLEQEPANLLNRRSDESRSDTHDIVLAAFLCDCLDAFHKATRHRSRLRAQGEKENG